MKRADLRDMFRKSSKSVCTSTVVVWYLLTLMTPNQQMKGIFG
jgi:hypothetical protein